MSVDEIREWVEGLKSIVGTPLGETGLKWFGILVAYVADIEDKAYLKGRSDGEAKLLDPLGH